MKQHTPIMCIAAACNVYYGCNSAAMRALLMFLKEMSSTDLSFKV